MIQKKLVSGYVLIALILLVFVIVQSYFLISARQEVQGPLNNAIERVDEKVATLQQMYAVEREINLAFMMGDPANMEVGMEAITEGEFADWVEQVETTVLEPLLSGDIETAQNEWIERLNESQQLQETFSLEFETAQDIGVGQAESLSTGMVTQLVINWVLLFIIVAIGLFVARKQARMVLIPLGRLVRQADRIATGNFSGEPLRVHSDDEFGSFTQSFNKMTAELKRSLEQTETASNELAATSAYLIERSEKTVTEAAYIESISQQAAEANENQFQITKKSEQATDDLSKRVEHITMALASAEDATDLVKKLVESGDGTVQQSSEQMNVISKNTARSATFVGQLSERAQDMIQAVNVLGAISKQTNLLALNAEIEAAHAGEYGKGFAVVAEQVRKLAAESEQSAKSVNQMIHKVQLDVNRVSDEMRTGEEEMIKGRKAMAEVRDVFEQIRFAVEQLNKEVFVVSTATQSIAGSTIELAAQITGMRSTSEASGHETNKAATAATEQLVALKDVIESIHLLERTATQLLENTKSFNFTEEKVEGE